MSQRRRNLIRLAIVAVCVAAVAWTVHSLGPEQIWQAVKQADPRWLGLAFLAIVARFLIWGAKWQAMLRRREHVPLGQCVSLVLAGAFANLTTPTAKLAGGVVRAALLSRRRGWPVLEAYGWALADQTTNILGQWLLFGILGIAAFPSLPPGPLRTMLPIVGAIVVIGVLGFGLMRRRLWPIVERRVLGRAIARLIPARFRGDRPPEIYDEWLGRVLRPTLQHGGMASTFLPDVLLGAVGFSALCVSNAMILRALGADAPVVLVSVAVMLGYFAGTLVGAWGGIGVTEAALTGLFVQIGVPLEMAATGALLHRALFYLVGLAGGGPVLAKEVRARKDSGVAEARGLTRASMLAVTDVRRAAGSADQGFRKVGAVSTGDAVSLSRSDEPKDFV
jgi:uncharacterized membrane protein YbhN (UPF0104 family)